MLGSTHLKREGAELEWRGIIIEWGEPFEDMEKFSKEERLGKFVGFCIREVNLRGLDTYMQNIERYGEG